MQHETVIVLDFGGQYNQLIARRVRENNVYCEIYSYKTDLSVIKAKNPKGIIFTGGPNSVYLEDSPTIDPEIFSWGVPVLGICYGSQLMMHLLGGHVCRAPEREYGKTEVFVDNSSKMFTDVQPSTVCWMSHNDYIEQAAPGFKITAHTVNCPVAAAENEEKGLYAVQFHPEVNHTEEGSLILRNFLYRVCKATGDWTMADYRQNAIRSIRNRRAEMNVPPSKKAALYVLTSKPQVFTEGEGFILRLAYADSMTLLDAEPENLNGMVTCATADAKLYIPMGQLVDVAKELERINKELEKARKNLASLEGKLSNESFISRAPEAVVAAERAKAQKARDLIVSLEESLKAMQAL